MIATVSRRERWEEAALHFSEQHIGTCCCGGVGYVRTNAPLGHILFGKGIPCVCQRDEQKRNRARGLRRASGISERELADWHFSAFRPEMSKPGPGVTRPDMLSKLRRITETCQQYAERPTGWLLLSGPTGTGKTHLAYAIAAACMARDMPVFAHTVPDLLELLRESYGANTHQETLETLKTVELLVLDDLGAQRDTGWALDTLYQIVNHRYAKALPMVVTTNCDLHRAGLDQRLVSRLLDGSEAPGGFSKVLSLPCADFRPTRRA